MDSTLQPSAQRNHAVDGLRGLFALGVMLYHLCLWTAYPIGATAELLLFKLAIYGVAGFFVISGYSLMLAYGARIETKAQIRYYALRRFLRIAPLYVAVCMAFLAGRLLFCDATCRAIEEDALRFLLNISLSFGFFNPGHNSFVVGGWSIGLEIVYYLCFPFLVAYAHGVWLWGVTLLALAYNQFHMNQWLDQSLSFGENFTAYAQAPALLVYFLVGMLIAQHRAALHRLFHQPKISALVLVLLLAYVPLRDATSLDVVTGANGLAMTLLTFLLVAAVCACHLRGGFSQAIAAFLGKISYALYLTHFIVYELVKRFITPVEGQIALTILLTFCVASLVYHVLEKPFLRLGRG